MEFQDINEFLSLLEDDRLNSASILQANDNQYTRRTYVRAFFSNTEGLIQSLRHRVLDDIKNFGGPFTTAEIAILKEEAYALSRNGDATTQKRHSKTEDLMKFVIKMSAKAYETKFDLNLSNKGWESFLASLEIRNRVTHPRNVEDLTITDSDLTTVRQAETWLHSTIDSLMTTLRDKAGHELKTTLEKKTSYEQELSKLRQAALESLGCKTVDEVKLELKGQEAYDYLVNNGKF